MTDLATAQTMPARNLEQQQLLQPLLGLLERRRWINQHSVVHTEFAWNGRRADVVTHTKTGLVSAFELKLGSFHRVLEQAMYNRLAFDRSWIVIAQWPRRRNLMDAVDNGIGVLLFDATMHVLHLAARQPVNPVVRSRLLLELGKRR